jgi:hypothetical protein
VTTKADFTEEEWDAVLEGPPSAGLIVSTAERGGTFREAFSIAKAYAEARKEHGESELLDEIVAAKPEVDRARYGSIEELKEHHLGRLRDAVALLEQKSTPEEVDDYKGFVLAVAERVAGAKTEEGDQPATDKERAAIAAIAEAIGATSLPE